MFYENENDTMSLKGYIICWRYFYDRHFFCKGKINKHFQTENKFCSQFLRNTADINYNYWFLRNTVDINYNYWFLRNTVDINYNYWQFLRNTVDINYNYWLLTVFEKYGRYQLQLFLRNTVDINYNYFWEIR